jgi:3-oxosteroid 1-dehydrogenase
MEMSSAARWDHTVDLLVVGSGAGALTTAIAAHDRGARVLVVEKAPVYGGSSAMSGGSVWIPNNHLMVEAGVNDSPEDALRYLQRTTAGSASEERLRAFVDTAPRMLEYLCERSRLRVSALPNYCDYYPAVPGARPGGRSLEADYFDGRVLGDALLTLREPAVQVLVLGRVMMTARDARTMLVRTRGWVGLFARLMFGYWLDLPWRFRSQRDRNLTMGNALVGMLRASLADRGVPLWLSSPARELVLEDGRVAGAVVENAGRPIRIRAARGVVLAAGGFEGSQAMREKYLPSPTRAEWSAANPDNTGDAITLGLAAGASLDLMDEAWWGPTTCVPGEPTARMLVIEKGLPGSILVNKAGERFVNEASPYIDVVKGMYKAHTPDSPCVPAYLVFDASFRRRYPFGPLLQAAQQPDWAIPRRLTQGYLQRSATIEGLAAALGVDARGLAATVAKVGDYARTGRDLEFHRGENIFDRYYGDTKVKPNACLAALDTPPYYGIEVYAGELGTKGGLAVDARARVLREGGDPIPGLWAIGNCSAALMGRTYAGAGATLGPAMTFGFIAAHDAVPDGPAA